MALTVASLVPEYVRGNEHGYFADVERVESSGILCTLKGEPDINGAYYMFQTFTESDTRKFRSIISAMGCTYKIIT